MALDPLLARLKVLVRLDMRADVGGDEEVCDHGVLAEVAEALQEGHGGVHPARVEDHRDVLHATLWLVGSVEALKQRVGREARHQLVVLAVLLHRWLHVRLRDHLGRGLLLARLHLAGVGLVGREALLVRRGLRLLCLELLPMVARLPLLLQRVVEARRVPAPLLVRRCRLELLRRQLLAVLGLCAPVLDGLAEGRGCGGCGAVGLGGGEEGLGDVGEDILVDVEAALLERRLEGGLDFLVGHLRLGLLHEGAVVRSQATHVVLSVLPRRQDGGRRRRGHPVVEVLVGRRVHLARARARAGVPAVGPVLAHLLAAVLAAREHARGPTVGLGRAGLVAVPLLALRCLPVELGALLRLLLLRLATRVLLVLGLARAAVDGGRGVDAAAVGQAGPRVVGLLGPLLLLACLLALLPGLPLLLLRLLLGLRLTLLPRHRAVVGLGLVLLLALQEAEERAVRAAHQRRRAVQPGRGHARGVGTHRQQRRGVGELLLGHRGRRPRLIELGLELQQLRGVLRVEGRDEGVARLLSLACKVLQRRLLLRLLLLLLRGRLGEVNLLVLPLHRGE
eukprot:scaffold59941_cov62-Phaeocystis_antarctica.AAC.3